MSSKIKCVTVGYLQTNCYIVENTDKGFLAVIDPGDNVSRIEACLESEPTHIILTHCHFDHIGALMELRRNHPSAIVAVGKDENMDPEHIARIAQGALGSFFFKRDIAPKIQGIGKADVLLDEGDMIGPFQVLHTPGHTYGSICLLDNEDKILISGDTLFMHSYGRTDLGGNDADMRSSLIRLLGLDGEIKVFPGHGEDTTIAEEKSFFIG